MNTSRNDAAATGRGANVAISGSTGLSQQQAGRVIWMALIISSGIGLSLFFACATPFAALATATALNIDRRDTAVAVGLVWLGNQAVGYGFLGYPWTWDSALWGIAIGLSAGLALVAAMALSPRRAAPLAVSLPFVAAFAAYELGLYVAGFVLPGSEGAFTAAIVQHLFLVNLVALIGMIAACKGVMLGGRLVRNHATAAAMPGVASFQ